MDGTPAQNGWGLTYGTRVHDGQLSLAPNRDWNIHVQKTKKEKDTKTKIKRPKIIR